MNIELIIFAALLISSAVLTYVFPSIATQFLGKTTFFDGYVNHEMINSVGLIVTITFSVIFIVFIEIKKIEDSKKKLIDVDQIGFKSFFHFFSYHIDFVIFYNGRLSIFF